MEAYKVNGMMKMKTTYGLKIAKIFAQQCRWKRTQEGRGGIQHKNR